MDKAAISFAVDGMLGQMAMELSAYMTLLRAGQVRKAGHCQYYAAYDACCALLLTKGIRVERHEGAQSLISLHFVKSGVLPRDTATKLNQLMGQRHAIDYNAEVPIGYEEVTAFHGWLIDFTGSVLTLIDKSRFASKAALAAARKSIEDAREIPPDASVRPGQKGSPRR